MKTTLGIGSLARGALNAPFTTLLSFLPMFGTRSVKTRQLSALSDQRKVKTDD